MPRGYLKHQQEASRKQARGGSSHSNKTKTSTGRKTGKKHTNQKQHKGSGWPSASSLTETENTPRHENHSSRSIWVRRYCRGVLDDEDFVAACVQPVSKKTVMNKTTPFSECLICFETRPLITFSGKCNWHDGACYECLRRLYVSDASTNMIRNYPLQCFHPQCQRILQFSQLDKHNLFHTEKEVYRFYEMLTIQKIGRIDRLKTVHCPECDMPRAINGVPQHDRVISCRFCGKHSQVTPFYTTIRAMLQYRDDKLGGNDGIARCPNCSILISKGDGCNHMVCIYCNHDFGWREAVQAFLPIARPPDNEMFLWW